MEARRDVPTVGALSVLAAVIVVTGMALTYQDRWVTVPVAVVAAAVLLWLAWRSGITWRALGMSRAAFAPGLRWGGMAAAVVLIGGVGIARAPLAAGIFDDDTMPTSTLEAVLRVAVVIPLRTVLVEELAFRGVLWGGLEQRWGPRAATLWAAVAFGLWHVPAGMRLVESNEAVADMVGGSVVGACGVVAAVVVGTALAGVLFSELRRRSGSLLAPMLLHWSVNSLGTVLSFVR